MGFLRDYNFYIYIYYTNVLYSIIRHLRQPLKYAHLVLPGEIVYSRCACCELRQVLTSGEMGMRGDVGTTQCDYDEYFCNEQKRKYANI